MWGEYEEVVRNTVLIPKAPVKPQFVQNQSLIRQKCRASMRQPSYSWDKLFCPKVFQLLKSSSSFCCFPIDSVLVLFICSHEFRERGLKLIVPLCRQLSLSFVSLSLWYCRLLKTATDDTDGSVKQQGTSQTEASSRGLLIPNHTP